MAVGTVNKRVVVLLLVFLFLVAYCLIVQFDGFGNANPVYLFGQKALYVNYSIISPSQKTYNSSSVHLNFTVKSNDKSTIPYYYILDNQAIRQVEKVNVTGQETIPNDSPYASAEYGTLNITEYTLQGYTLLRNLSEGRHTVTLYGVIDLEFPSDTVVFNVDTSPPRIVVLSSGNQAYNSSDVPLNFNVSESVIRISYSFDGQDNMTIAGNTTLIGLPNGSHSVTVYACDEAGNIGASETICFTVAAPLPTTPFPMTEAATISAGLVLIIIAVVLLVHFRKLAIQNRK